MHYNGPVDAAVVVVVAIGQEDGIYTFRTGQNRTEEDKTRLFDLINPKEWSLGHYKRRRPLSTNLHHSDSFVKWP